MITIGIVKIINMANTKGYILKKLIKLKILKNNYKKNR